MISKKELQKKIAEATAAKKAELMAKGMSEADAEAMAAELASKDVTLMQALEENENLQSKLEEASAEKQVEKPVVTSSKKVKYQLTIPKFRHNGKLHTAAELKDNPELVDELVEMEFAGLVPVKTGGK